MPVQDLTDKPVLANSVSTIAARCSVSSRTVWNWINDGKLKATRIGGRVLIQEGEIIRFLKDAEA